MVQFGPIEDIKSQRFYCTPLLMYPKDDNKCCIILDFYSPVGLL